MQYNFIQHDFFLNLLYMQHMITLKEDNKYVFLGS